MSLVYTIGGAVTAITGTTANVQTAMPTLTGAGETRFIVVQMLGAATAVIKTGDATDDCTDADDGILLQRNSGDLVLKVQGHAFIHCWASGATTIYVVPLAEDPGH